MGGGMGWGLLGGGLEEFFRVKKGGVEGKEGEEWRRGEGDAREADVGRVYPCLAIIGRHLLVLHNHTQRQRLMANHTTLFITLNMEHRPQ